MTTPSLSNFTSTITFVQSHYDISDDQLCTFLKCSEARLDTLKRSDDKLTTDELTRLLRGLQSVGVNMDVYAEDLYYEPIPRDRHTDQMIDNFSIAFYNTKASSESMRTLSLCFYEFCQDDDHISVS